MPQQSAAGAGHGHGHGDVLAEEITKAALDQGDADMQADRRYWLGLGVPQDAKAAALYQQAADQGHVGGQVGLGACYFYGHGVDQDQAKAAMLYQQAADQGHAGAQVGLGNCYFYGQGVDQDQAIAAVLFQLAADQKNPVGQFGLGECYMFGLGVERDETKGAALFQQAADQGCEEGQFGLGECYFLGRGVEQDHEKAASFFRLAADQGHSRAQARLIKANEALAADQQRRAAEAEQAMQSLLDEEDAMGGATAGKQSKQAKPKPKKTKKKNKGSRSAGATSITPAAADTAHLDATKEKARVEEEGRVQRVREQLLHERAEEAEQQQAFEEAKATHMQALAAALHATDGVEAGEPCPPQYDEQVHQQAMLAPPTLTEPPELLPECPVCLACYQQPPSVHAPVSLPCGHSVCRQCALDLLQTAAPSQHSGGGGGGTGGLAIACPSCCQQLELPPGGAQALPCNYGLVQMLGQSAPRPLPPQRAAATGVPLSCALPAASRLSGAVLERARRGQRVVRGARGGAGAHRDRRGTDGGGAAGQGCRAGAVQRAVRA